jgi:hypothetical protein
MLFSVSAVAAQVFSAETAEESCRRVGVSACRRIGVWGHAEYVSPEVDGSKA